MGLREDIKPWIVALRLSKGEGRLNTGLRERIAKFLSIPPSWLLALLIGSTLLGTVFGLWKVWMIFGYDGDNTYPESTIVRIALWAAHTGHLFPKLDASPFTPAPYGPLLYLSLAGIARLGSLDFLGLLRMGRELVFACFLLTAWVAYRWSRRAGLRPFLALLSSTFILSQYDFAEWNVSVRPDAIALFLDLLAIYFISRAEFPSVADAILGGLCLGFAVLFKQSYSAAALAIGLWLLFHVRIRQLIIVSVAAMLPVATTFGLLLLRHEPVFQEAALFRSSIVNPASGLALLKKDLLQFPSQGILLSLGLLGLWVALTESPIRARLLGIYWLLACCVAISLSTGPGSSTNAFLEIWTIAALLVPFAVRKMMVDWSTASPVLRAALLLLLLWTFGLGLEAWRTQVALGRRQGFKGVAWALEGREYLSDNSYLAVQAKTPVLLDPSVNHYLELAGRWSPQPVIDELNNQNYDVVVLGLDKGRLLQWRGYTLFSPAVLRGIQQTYEVSCLTERLAVMTPRSDPHHNREQLLARLSQAGCRIVDQATATQSLFATSVQP